MKNTKQMSLNDMYNQYSEKKINIQDLESGIFNYYFKNKRKTCLRHWTQDEYEDFVSWFYPKIKKAISKYINIGYSFETYINKFFFLSSKEYNVHIISTSITEYSAWSAQIPDIYVYEETPEYLTNYNEKYFTDLIQKGSSRNDARRLLALVLKCYYYVSDDFIEKAAPVLKVSQEELKNMMNKIRLIRKNKDDALYYKKERLYSLFFKCIVLEKKLLYARENTAIYNKLEKQLNKGKIRLEKLRNELKNTKYDASNSQIAQVIGIKKGSVDSSIYKLKEKFNLN